MLVAGTLRSLTGLPGVCAVCQTEPGALHAAPVYQSHATLMLSHLSGRGRYARQAFTLTFSTKVDD